MQDCSSPLGFFSLFESLFCPHHWYGDTPQDISERACVAAEVQTNPEKARSALPYGVVVLAEVDGRVLAGGDPDPRGADARQVRGRNQLWPLQALGVCHNEREQGSGLLDKDSASGMIFLRELPRGASSLLPFTTGKAAGGDDISFVTTGHSALSQIGRRR